MTQISEFSFEGGAKVTPVNKKAKPAKYTQSMRDKDFNDIATKLNAIKAFVEPEATASPTELPLSVNAVYSEGVGNKAWTIADLSELTGNSKTEIYKGVGINDVITLDLTNTTVAIIGDGWTESEGIWTLKTATSSQATATCYLQILRSGTKIVKIESSFSEPFTIEGGASTIDRFKVGVNVTDGGAADDMTITSIKLGVALAATGEAEPTYDVENGTMAFNGVDDAMILRGGTLCTLISNALNNRSFKVYAVVIIPSSASGSVLNVINVYNGTSAGCAVTLQITATGKLQAVLRDNTLTPVLLAPTVESIVYDQPTIIEIKYDNSNLSAAINGGTYATVANTAVGNFNGLDEVAVGYRDLGGTEGANIPFTWQDLSFNNSDLNRSRIIANLKSEYGIA